MIEAGVASSIADRARAAGLDPRTLWCGPDAEGAVRAWPADAARTLGVEAVSAHGPVRIISMLEPVRGEAAHRAEMITEVRGGEHLIGIVRRGDWWVIAGEDGYVGWVHGWVIADRSPADDGDASWLGRYALPHGTLWIADHHAGVPLVMGTPLFRPDTELVARADWRLVRTPTGQEGWIPADSLEATIDASAAAVLRRARSLLGVPYRWGGRSPLGFDCSGFVQFVFALGGHALPRDASQQQGVGEAVAHERAEWKAGDLLFFGDPADHVGIFDGRASMIHCRGSVVKQELGAIGPLLERLTHVRRIDLAKTVDTAAGWIRPAHA